MRSRWPHYALAILAVLVPIATGLEAATFGYVISIERRLTRLETLAGIPAASSTPAPSPPPREIIIKRPDPARRRLLVREPGDERGDEGREIVARIERPPDR